jgi:hypothetical protein
LGVRKRRRRRRRRRRRTRRRVRTRTRTRRGVVYWQDVRWGTVSPCRVATVAGLLFGMARLKGRRRRGEEGAEDEGERENFNHSSPCWRAPSLSSPFPTFLATHTLVAVGAAATLPWHNPALVRVWIALACFALSLII